MAQAGCGPAVARLWPGCGPRTPFPPREPQALSAFAPSLGPEDTRIIIFTSGTTGQPKGVRLSYAAYHTNRATFEDFLRVPSGCEFVPFVCNPMARVNVKCI